MVAATQRIIFRLWYISNFKFRDIGPLDTWSWIRWHLLQGALGNVLLLQGALGNVLLLQGALGNILLLGLLATSSYFSGLLAMSSCSLGLLATSSCSRGLLSPSPYIDFLVLLFSSVFILTHLCHSLHFHYFI